MQNGKILRVLEGYKKIAKGAKGKERKACGKSC